ncbi:MAG: VOC family protein [Armatimonadota bacterium]
MQKITPCLWFDGQAEEAATFYCSVFGNSKISSITRYGEAAAEASGMPKGSVMLVAFQLEGQDFVALNGGPEFTFSPAISLMVSCETQAEVDRLWEKLTEGGEEVECGWLRDKYGVSWQIVPSILGEVMQDKDPVKTERFMRAVLKMKKFDVEELKRAYEGG